MEPDMAVSMAHKMNDNECPIDVIHADNDSTTMLKLKLDFENLKKKDDQNHTTKGITKSLIELSKRHKELKPGEVIPYLNRCFMYAITQNSSSELQIDEGLSRIVPHVFGDHELCGAVDWCTFKDDPISFKYESLPNGKPLISEDLRRDLENLIEKYKSKASSLRNLGSTQANESFNHSVATKAPKSKHYGGSQSLASRVSSAVLQKNEGYNYLEQMNEAALLSPGEYTKSIAKKLDTEKLKRKIKRQSREFKKKRTELKKKRNKKERRLNIHEPVSYQSEVVTIGLSDTEAITIPSPLKLDGTEFFTFFDLETTGLSRVSDITQIAAVHDTELQIRIHKLDFDSQSKPAVYNVYKGDDITLEQHIYGQQKLLAVKWFKESDKWTELDISNEQYRGVVPGLPSLTLKTTTIGNAGKYACLLIYDNGETRTSLFKLKIIPQVEIYQALSEHRKEKTFLRPGICDTIDQHMQENNIVVITGREGTGKSKICLELASRYEEKDYMVLKVDLSENHPIYTDIANALLIIDDEQYTQNSLNAFMKHLLPVMIERNIQVVLTCRNLDLKIVRNVPEINKLKSEAFIDINSCLTPEEKEEILRRYMKENNISSSASYESNFRDPKIVNDLSVHVTLDKDAIKAIKTEEPWKGFPVCASLFCSKREFLHLGEKYFTNPPKYLFEELKELHKTARKKSNSMDTVTEYCILVYILQNSNHQLDLNDPDLCKKLIELYLSIFQLKYTPEKLGSNEEQMKMSVEKATHRMLKKYLKLHEGVYEFIHPCLSKAMFLSSDSMVYYLLQNGSIQDITEFVRGEDYKALENELVIKIDKQYHHILCERLVRHAFENHESLLKVADYICTCWRLSGEDYTGLEDELVIKITKDFPHLVDESFMKHVSEDHDLLVKIAEYIHTHLHSSGNMLVNVFFGHIAFILFGIYTNNLQQLDIEQNIIETKIQVSLSLIVMFVERLTSQGRDPWIYGAGTEDFLILSGLVTAAVGGYAAKRKNQTFKILLSEFQKRIHTGAFVELLSKPLDRYGNTFFHYLMVLSQEEASAILNVYAEMKYTLDTENVKKYTPLDIVAFLGKIDIFIKVLNLKTSNCTHKLRKRLKRLARSGKAAYYKENSKNISIDQPMIYKTKDDSSSPCSPEKHECEDADINDKKEVKDENKKDKSFLKRKFSLRNEEHNIKKENHDKKDVLCFENFMNNIVDNGKIEDYQSIIELFSK